MSPTRPARAVPLPVPVAAMSQAEKVAIVFQEAAKQLPPAVGGALLEAVTPANIGLTVAVFVAFAAGQALGYGLIVDIVAIGGGLLIVGASAIDGLTHLVDAVSTTLSARTHSDLQDAGRALAQAVLALGVGTLIALLTKKAIVKTRVAGSATIVVRGRYPTYSELRAAIRASESNGAGFEAHHLWEKQFARLIGVSEDDIIAAPVLRRYHRAVNRIVKTPGQPLGIPYGIIDSNIDVMITSYIEQRLGVPRASATLQQAWVAHREVYLRLGQGGWADAVYELYVKPRGVPYWGGAR